MIHTIKIQDDEYYPEGEWRIIAHEKDKGKVDDDIIYFYVDDDSDMNKLKVGDKIMLDEEFTILGILFNGCGKNGTS